MTVSMGIKYPDSDRYEVVPIATSDYFSSHWLPACAQLGLKLIAHFHDGALTTIMLDDLPEIVVELETLRTWTTAKEESAPMTERIDGLLFSLRETAGAACEYDFG